MEITTQPNRLTLTTELARLDVQTWAKKTVREAVSIAARGNKNFGKTSVDPGRVDAVLGLLVQEIEAERRALVERNAPSG